MKQFSLTQNTRVEIHQRYDWNSVVQRQPIAILMGLFWVLGLHGGGRALRVECSGGVGSGLEFLVKFGYAIAVIESLHWLVWRASMGRKAPAGEIKEQEEVPFTGGVLFLLPKRVHWRFLLWLALIAWSFYMLYSLGPCEAPRLLSFRGSTALLVFAYTSLMAGTFMDFYERRGGG